MGIEGIAYHTSPPTIRGISIQMATIYVPVTVLAASVTTDISIETITTAAGTVMPAPIRRDITTGKDTTGRATIDRTRSVTTEEVTLADNNSEIFL